jgi:hypothetical protein
MSIKGFNNQKGLGNSEFLSVLSGGSDKKAIPTLGMGVYPVLAATAISSVTRSTDEKTLDIDFGVATSARKGDILRMVTGTLPAWEFEIITIVSANVVRVWNISPSLPLATETASILRPVTLQLDSSGNITVTPAAGGATEAKQDAQIVLIGGVTEAAPATDTASSGLNGRLQRIAQRLTSLIALLPGSLGQKTGANSLAVVIASDQTLPLPSGAATAALQTAEATLIGDVVEAAPATDTASSGLNGRLQRIAQRITSMIALLPASIGQKAKAASLAVSWSTEGEAQIGSVTEVAPASDTASSGLNGRLQRIAQNITSMIALLPASLGQKARAASLSVAWSTEQEAQIGIVTEAAPASDTASSGLNGRLQRIAQRITSLIALVPASLGQKTMANSFAVTIASDQTAVQVNDSTSVAGTITTSQETVGLVRSRATVGAIAPSATRKRLRIKPASSNTGRIWIGGSTVTIATGLEIIGPDVIDWEYDAGDYYLISDTAAQVVEILEKA